MPEFLGMPTPVQTEDDYTQALTLGPAINVRQIGFSLYGSNGAIAQFWKLAPQDDTKPVLEPYERNYPAGSAGVIVSNVAGVRFRSAVAGKPATLVAEMAFLTDPVITPGQLSIANVNNDGTTSIPVVVNVTTAAAVSPPALIRVADPGPGVSDIPIYTVPANTIGRIELVTYAVAWDTGGGLGDRAVLYELIDDSSTHVAWAQSGNTFYAVGSTPSRWLETDVGSMGNFLRSIFSTIPVDPIDSNLDFEQASAPFGQMFLPPGFSVSIIVPQMAATDEVSAIALMVTEVALS